MGSCSAHGATRSTHRKSQFGVLASRYFDICICGIRILAGRSERGSGPVKSGHL